MLWDEDGSSWASFKFPSNPGAVMLDADGQIIKVWYGKIPKDKDILALA